MYKPITYQIDMSFIRIIKFRDDIGKLSKDLVVPGHVRCEDAPDDPFAHYSIRCIVQGS